MLKPNFAELLSGYTSDRSLTEILWAEIEKHYSYKRRYYHTLTHLENLLIQLNEVRSEIEDWSCILFTLYYHDVIYNSLKSDNEEKSAELAVKRMKELNASEALVERCKLQIIATKSHVTSLDGDTNYFLDADLSVLGQNWETYSEYAKNVRKEYSIYPDLVYNPGRNKVLQHFLDMQRIFKTDYFFSKFEEQAKENLRKEMFLLNQ